MAQLFLIAAAVILFIASRRLYHKNIELFLIILMLCNFQFFHLITVMRHSSNLRLLSMPIIIAVFIEMIMMKKKISIGKYGGWVIMFIVLLVNGVLVAAFIGQPMLYGIKAVKFYSLILVYFFVVNHEIDNDKFIDYLTILAVLIAGLAAVQYVFQSHIQIFKTVGASEVRTARIGEGALLISMVIVFSFINFLKKRKWIYLFVFIALLTHLIFVIQTRMLIAGVISTSILVYFIYYKFSVKAIASFVIVSFIASVTIVPLISFDQLSVVQQTMTDFDNDVDTASSYLARLRSFEFYFNRLMEAPIFGYGYMHIFWSGELFLQRKGYHLSDIGLMGFAIKTGLVGLTWLCIGFVRFITAIFKQQEMTVVGTYILFGMTTMFTIDIFLTQNTIFMFGLFLGLFSNEFTQKEAELAGYNSFEN